MPGFSPRHAVLYAVVLIAAMLAVAHAAIFVRLADADPLVTAAYRMLIAALALLPFALMLARDQIRALTIREWGLIAVASVFLALHFAAWIEGVARTSIANAVVLVTLTPVWLALWAALVRTAAAAGTAALGWPSAWPLAVQCGDGLGQRPGRRGDPDAVTASPWRAASSSSAFFLVADKARAADRRHRGVRHAGL